MAQDISSTSAGTNVQDDFSVSPATTDGAETKETRWSNTNWTTWLGYFNEVPELNSVITAKAVWTVGKGFKADPETTELLNKYRGNGRDTFNSILKNAIMTYQVGGDFFAEIIRDDGIFRKLFTWFGVINPGKPVNLKPLDPGSMVIIADGKGFIKKYEQVSKVEGKANKKFKPEKIFHLARNRFADNVHGTSLTEKLVKIILSRNESMDDYKLVQHRFVKPRWIIKLNTDNTTKITAEKVKWDKANADGENMYIPMGAVEAEQMSISEGSTLNPLDWQRTLKDSFYEESGVPKIIIGNASGVAEAGVKVVYLAFQQTIEEEQLFIQDQVLSQLGLKIDLEFPVRLEESLTKTESKEGAPIKKSDTTASLTGNK